MISTTPGRRSTVCDFAELTLSCTRKTLPSRVRRNWLSVRDAIGSEAGGETTPREDSDLLRFFVSFLVFNCLSHSYSILCFAYRCFIAGLTANFLSSYRPVSGQVGPGTPRTTLNELLYDLLRSTVRFDIYWL